MVFNRGGSSAGVTRGEFRIDTSQVQQARRTVEDSARGMGAAYRQMGRDAQEGGKQASQAIQDAARQAQEGRRLIEGLFSTVFLQRGVAAAQNIARLDTTFRILSGSQERANANMEQLRRLSERTGAPMLQLKESAAGILIAVGRANIELDKAVSIAQRLAVVDPFQGVRGSSIALREFLSGDVRSLALRFELPRGELQRIREAAGGDPQKMIEGLDKFIDRMGVTEEAMRQFTEEGANAFEFLAVVIEETMGQAFAPIRGLVVDASRALITLSRERPALLQTAVSIGAITAALVAMRFAAGQAQAALAGIRGSVPGRALGLGLAVGGGAFIGTEIARALAERTDLQSGDLNRIREGEDPSAILAERLNQALVVFTEFIKQAGDTIINFASILTLGVQLVSNAFNLVGAALSLGANILKEGFGAIQEGLGLFLIKFADTFSGVTDTSGVGRAGLSLVESGSRARLEAQGQRQVDTQTLERGIGITPQQAAQIAADNERIRNDWANTMRGVQTGLIDFLFPALRQTEEAAQAPVNPLQTMIDAMKQALPAFAEMQKEVRELTDTFDEESRRLADARSLADAREEFDVALARSRRVRDFNIGLAQTDVDFFRTRTRQFRDFNASLTDLEANAEERRLEAAENFRREDLRRAEDFGRRLAEIEAQTRINVLEAANRLDARAVFEAQRRGTQQVNQVTGQFEVENARREADFQQQLQQLQANLIAQRNQRIAAFNQAQADQIEDFNLQRQRRLDAFELQRQDEEFDRELRRTRLLEDREIEDRMRQDALNKKITDLQRSFIQESGLNQAFATNVSSLWSGIRTSGMQALSEIQAYGTSVHNQLQTLFNQFQASSGTTQGFQHGGFPPLNRRVRVNETGLESALTGGRLALFGSPATIFSASQTQQLLAGASGTTVNLNGDIVVGDIGDRSDGDVINLINRGLQEFFNSA